MARDPSWARIILSEIEGCLLDYLPKCSLVSSKAEVVSRVGNPPDELPLHTHSSASSPACSFLTFGSMWRTVVRAYSSRARLWFAATILEDRGSLSSSG